MVSEAPAREGVPPCVRMTLFDDRVATLADRNQCGHGWSRRYFINAGVILVRERQGKSHPEFLDYSRDPVFQMVTDDEAEAEAAYGRAQEWVLHEVLPDD